MKTNILKAINKIMKKSYTISVIVVLLFIASISYFIIYIVNKKYTTTEVAIEVVEVTQRTSSQTQTDEKINELKEIIEENTKEKITEELYVEEVDLEFTTKYEQSDKIATGSIQVIQEGIDGTQKITKKRTYKNGELVSDEAVGSQITKASVNKIVQIGTGPSYLKYTVSKDDTMYVTSSILSVMSEPSQDAEKILTLNKNDEVKIVEISKEWYKIKYNIYVGWVKADCLTKSNPNQTEVETTQNQYSASQLKSKLSFDMKLNTPSGLSLEQFEKIFANESNDKNEVFKDNAKYFYYAEQQYNINGVFLAAVAIHESAWGTSAMSKNKKNLFGYGAYDRDPSGNAYVFSSYSESIDLLARVFVKYYLNPKGTEIYNGEKASGSHYNGATVTGVNKHYATDSNWKNAVYKWMSYLYNKL